MNSCDTCKFSYDLPHGLKGCKVNQRIIILSAEAKPCYEADKGKVIIDKIFKEAIWMKKEV